MNAVMELNLSREDVSFLMDRTEGWIRSIFITNGVLGIAGNLAYPLEVAIIAVLSGLTLWTIVFPTSTILLAINFKRKMKTLEGRNYERI
jgi:hypothetical protein